MARTPRTRSETPQSYEPLRGSERRARAGARRTRPADPAEKIDVTICVRRRPDAPQLPDQEYWARTPPGPRRFLARSDFVSTYGAAQADLEQVAAFARANGLTVVRTDSAQRVVLVSGTVAEMNAAFHVDLGQYESAAETYRGREGPVYVPKNLASVIEGVFGLDNRRMARRSSNGFTPVASITPVQVAQDYNFPAGDAANQTIGVFEFSDPNPVIGDSGYAHSDVTAYFTTSLGIGPGFTAPALTDITVNGPGNVLGGGGETEILIDICVAGAAQKAAINVYFATFDENGWVLSIKEAVHPTQGETQPSVVSICWQWGEFGASGI
jgi:subtilase family serine protease